MDCFDILGLKMHFRFQKRCKTQRVDTNLYVFSERAQKKRKKNRENVKILKKNAKNGSIEGEKVLKMVCMDGFSFGVFRESMEVGSI